LLLVDEDTDEPAELGDGEPDEDVDDDAAAPIAAGGSAGEGKRYATPLAVAATLCCNGEEGIEGKDGEGDWAGEPMLPTPPPPPPAPPAPNCCNRLENGRPRVDVAAVGVEDELDGLDPEEFASEDGMPPLRGDTNSCSARSRRSCSSIRCTAAWTDDGDVARDDDDDVELNAPPPPPPPPACCDCATCCRRAAADMVAARGEYGGGDAICDMSCARMRTGT
jgi:hypothetical protein